MAKWEQWSDIFGIVVTITDEEPFSVVHLFLFSRPVQIGWTVFQPLWKSL